ncbi:TraR/DksA C4-type zinc finger protein [Wukongibacter sp. M2B1]|uniref:TraR/DksA C4-type zinc finger protein n=1 Tax=Wukongibacter sp. M2B1 TaxID=3088895 RepID=UPI003D7BC012
MDKKDLQHFKDRLFEEKQEVLNGIESEEENGVHSPLKDYYSELSVYDNHPADIGSETFEMEMRFNLEESEKRHLIQINDALDKIESGTYGICETCGKSINKERLEVIPYTDKCANCSKETEHMSLDEKIHTRPVEEEVLDSPFGRTFNDDSRFNGFDGEDSWQAVARYNKTDKQKMALDWYDNNMYDKNISGKVEDVDDISNEYYEKQVESEKKE